MNEKTATIIGSTGLIGSHLLHRVLQDDYFTHVKLIARRELLIKNSKVSVAVIDFRDTESYRAAISGSDAVFCAIGTTQKQVKGNKTEYRKIDFDIPVTAARLCAQEQIPNFLLVSSVGANSKSGNFYLKLKGEVEDAVTGSGVKAVSIFRPSMLLGNRKEFRLGEKIGQPVMKALAFLIPAKYKPVNAADVSKAMLTAAKRDKFGTFVYHYKEIVELANTNL